eukprot:TRINITY_DN4023_c0_g1_i4.p1 TRINITY_DN4023_c0_g1~~TRINITY_DN4023_c0_g1_i4.p1  ORF type:complete len:201 (-),score=42.98 TRINITY_DN4023_c0_g1_i4:232-834(-)
MGAMSLFAVLLLPLLHLVAGDAQALGASSSDLQTSSELSRRELRARVITTLYAHLTAGAVKTPGGGGVILVQGVGVSGSAELLLLSSRRIKFSVVASGAVPHANAGGPLVFNPLVIRTSVNLFKSNRTADELVSALTGTWKLLKKQKGVSLYRLKGITNITRSLVAALRSAPDQYYLQLFFPPYPHLSDFVYAIRGTLHK